MPIGEVDFDKVKDADDFSPAPKGDYYVQIIKVEEKSNKYGDYLWFTLRICEEGDHFNKRFWDKNQFHDENRWGIQRTKLFLSRFGVDVTGTVDFDNPEKLYLGRCAIATLDQEEYDTGKTDEAGEPIMRTKNVVDYSGYERVPEDFEAPAMDDVGTFDFSKAVDTSDEGGADGAVSDDEADDEAGGKDDLPFEFE